jgi:hypothetical protein
MRILRPLAVRADFRNAPSARRLLFSELALWDSPVLQEYRAMSTGTANSKHWMICEQTVKDPLTGITLRFDVLPEEVQSYCLRLELGHDFGHREFRFDRDGMFNGDIRSTPSHLKPYIPTEIPFESD